MIVADVGDDTHKPSAVTQRAPDGLHKSDRICQVVHDSAGDNEIHRLIIRGEPVVEIPDPNTGSVKVIEFESPLRDLDAVHLVALCEFLEDVPRADTAVKNTGLRGSERLDGCFNDFAMDVRELEVSLMDSLIPVSVVVFDP